jgi:hypothetical protein
VKKSPKKGDAAQKAWAVVQQVTGEESASLSNKRAKSVSSGSLGGTARAKKLTSAERSEIARLAAQARWKKSG